MLCTCSGVLRFSLARLCFTLQVSAAPAFLEAKLAVSCLALIMPQMTRREGAAGLLQSRAWRGLLSEPRGRRCRHTSLQLSDSNLFFPASSPGVDVSELMCYGWRGGRLIQTHCSFSLPRPASQQGFFTQAREEGGGHACPRAIIRGHFKRSFLPSLPQFFNAQLDFAGSFQKPAGKTIPERIWLRKADKMDPDLGRGEGRRSPASALCHWLSWRLENRPPFFAREPACLYFSAGLTGELGG